MRDSERVPDHARWPVNYNVRATDYWAGLPRALSANRQVSKHSAKAGRVYIIEKDD